MTEQKKRRITLYCLTMLSVIAALIFGYTSFRNTLEPQYWVRANQFLAENAADNSTVLSFWDNGWWILDQSSCTPFVSNGSHSVKRDQIVAEIYCATCDPCASRNCIANDISYVIFSEREDHVYSLIAHDCDYNGDKERTLWYRALQDDFSSKYFTVLYREQGIVVLEVTSE